MIGGQLLDLDGEDRPLSLAELERIHRAKTGALISASIELGGLMALADSIRWRALSAFGQAIGLAFQIADDVLDVTATTDRLGEDGGSRSRFAQEHVSRAARHRRRERAGECARCRGMRRAPLGEAAVDRTRCPCTLCRRARLLSRR